MEKRVIKGAIIFEPVAPDLTHARIYIHLQDTSMADGLATTVAEQILPQPSAVASDDGTVPFQIELASLDPRRRYSISVHVDRHGGNGTQIRSGDYINMASYPVLTLGHLDQVRVSVRRVQ